MSSQAAANSTPNARIYFSDFFGVSADSLKQYGAFNVACVVDLPLFVDPFLLFTSAKPEYKKLHQEIIQYLAFLRDKSTAGNINDGLLKAWYCFPEVKQNQFGFCLTGNNGRGLGPKFARALNDNLHHVFKNFGNEQITKGSHLEKLVLVGDHVGRDNISDFTTNLIKGYLLNYTQTFAQANIDPAKLKRIDVPRVKFNYEFGIWESSIFELPWLGDDYVLLTPEDMLTQDDTWINKEDLRRDFYTIKESVSNDALRAQINEYFKGVLPPKATRKEESAAIEKTLQRFHELIDYYIRQKETNGAEAIEKSAAKVRDVDRLFVQHIYQLGTLIAGHTDFYKKAESTLEETARKIDFLKQIIENQDGYRLFYLNGKPIKREKDLQILFKLVWEGSPSSVDAEVNNGRGPVDFKISRGSKDKTLVEFKLASNSSLAKNIQNQLDIYEKANKTTQSYTVILFFTELEEANVKNLLMTLKAPKGAGIVLIDGRNDNKPSGSKA
jgi:hypothetical protein